VCLIEQLYVAQTAKRPNTMHINTSFCFKCTIHLKVLCKCKNTFKVWWEPKAPDRCLELLKPIRN